MKRGAYLINTARGKICDTKAVRDACESGQLAGYAGDVWFPQPVPIHLKKEREKQWEMKKVWCTCLVIRFVRRSLCFFALVFFGFDVFLHMLLPYERPLFFAED